MSENKAEGGAGAPRSPTDTDLDSLERLLSEASPAPWRVWITGKCVVSSSPHAGDNDIVCEPHPWPERDWSGNAAAIAALRNSAPALLEELQSLRSWRKEAEALLREVEWRGEGGRWEEAGCPMCRAAQFQGHAAGCRLAAFLGEGKETAP